METCYEADERHLVGDFPCCREADSAALTKSLLKSDFKKMSAIQFKQALCMELLRCEDILKEALPSIIKV